MRARRVWARVLRWSFRAGAAALVTATLWKLFASGDFLLIAHGAVLVFLGCLAIAVWLAWKYSNPFRQAYEQAAKQNAPPTIQPAKVAKAAESRPERTH